MIKAIENKKIFIIISIVCFSIYPTLIDMVNDFLMVHDKSEIIDISTITRSGSLDGYTIVNFVLMYVLGCVYHHYENKISSKMKGKRFILIIALIIDIVLIFIWARLPIIYSQEIIGTALSYCNPLVILAALMVFALFNTIEFESEIVNKIAKSSFTTYLAHGYFLNTMVSNAPFNNTILLILYVLAFCITIYIILFVLHLCYSFTIGHLVNYFEERLPYEIKI